jgi:hypothetical protein
LGVSKTKPSCDNHDGDRTLLTFVPQEFTPLCGLRLNIFRGYRRHSNVSVDDSEGAFLSQKTFEEKLDPDYSTTAQRLGSQTSQGGSLRQPRCRHGIDNRRLPIAGVCAICGGNCHGRNADPDTSGRSPLRNTAADAGRPPRSAPHTFPHRLSAVSNDGMKDFCKPGRSRPLAAL